MPSGVYERSEEHNRHISEALVGAPRRPISEEARSNMSKAALEAWDRRREEGTTACPHTEESNRKVSKTLSGYSQTEEHRRNASEALQNQWKDPVIRGRRIEGLKRSWSLLTQEEKEERLEISFHSTTAKENFRKYCETHSGENHPNWREGYRDYRDGWRDVAYFIQVRDRFTCQKCGSTEDLCVHHIDYDTLNWSDDNLMTLCRSCNSVVNSDREYWTSYFGYLMKEINRIGDKEGKCLPKLS